MNVREWALVAFTLLMQTSVGILLIVAALHSFVSRASAHGPVRMFDASLLVACACAALALATSLVHLGQPLQAWLAPSNLRTSWLSREIASAAVFTLAAALVAVLFRGGTGLATARTAACAIAVALGVATVYVMGRVYMIPAQPSWNRIATPAAFFATTLLLGTLVVLVTLRGPGQSIIPWMRVLAIAAIAFLALQMLLLPAQLAAVAGEPAAAISPASAGHLAVWLGGVRALLGLAAALILVNMVRAAPGVPLLTSGVAALVLLFVSEVVGRVLFYASSVRI